MKSGERKIWETIRPFAPIAVALTLYIGLAVIGWWLFFEYAVVFGGPTSKEAISTYQLWARTPVFTSFFTMGSFLIALQTNILARIQTTYDTQSHRDAYRSARTSHPRARFYAGLEELGRALSANVVLCLFVSLFQLTLGFWANPTAIAICCGSATACLLFLIRLTFAMMKAHHDWFEKIESEAQQLLATLDKENSSQFTVGEQKGSDVP